MQFKKEFDIDREFFTEKPKVHLKRKLALKVFLFVLFITFALLCYFAFSYSFNPGFKSADVNGETVSLKDAQSFFFDAVRYYDDGNYEKALEYFNKQIEIVDDPDAYSYIAKIYLEENNTALAIEYFKKALQFKPDMFDANYELGKIYYSLNDFKNASKYLTLASSERIDNVEVLSLTAESYRQSGRADDAVKLFEKILEIEPTSAFANIKTGEIYFQRLQYKKASRYFEDALFISYNEEAAMMLAKCYFELGSLDEAILIANDILAQNKDNKQAQSLKRAAEYKKGLSQAQGEKIAQTEEKNDVQNEQINVPDPNIVKAYVKEIEMSIKLNWTPPVGSNLKKATVKFTVNKEGELVSNVIYLSSGLMEFDKSVLDAIEMSKPFPPLPDSLNRDTLDIIFTFDYNVNP